MVATLLASLATVNQETFDISRVFTKGEKLAYSVDANLTIEFRQGALKNFLVQQHAIEYSFTGEVTHMKTDGICQMHYKRPVMIETDFGTDASKPPTRSVEKVNYDLMLDVSPINEVLKLDDLAPPKKQPPKKDGLYALGGAGSVARLVQTQFQGEVFRLALFVGNMDSSLDLNPKLPFEPVKVGETWKKTVSYQPQVLQGKQKSAVQRLDMTYKYEGIVDDDNGKKVHRVTAEIKLDTDVATFLNGVMGAKPEESGLKSMKLKLDSSMTFNLDLKTRKTLMAQAESKGEMNIVLTNNQNEPAQEVKLTGRTTMVPKGS